MSFNIQYPPREICAQVWPRFAAWMSEKMQEDAMLSPDPDADIPVHDITFRQHEFTHFSEASVKVYVAPPPKLSQAMHRVGAALQAHLPPGHHVVDTPDQADLEVLHVIGYPETAARVYAAHLAGRKYVMIQYCYKTTQEPFVDAWHALWDHAEIVWSYYNLAEEYYKRINAPRFYHAPLGIDPAFHRMPNPLTERRDTTLLTTGYVAPSECLQECAEAVRRVGGRMRHIGPDLGLGEHVTPSQGVSDELLAAYYRQSRFVAGLRRVEGFELPVYEGLASGARPIVFDAPHYRSWLGEHALYIREYDYPPDMGDYRRDLDSAAITTQIAACLQTYAPVTSDEMRWVKEKFSWKPIIEGFWERAL